MVVECKPYEGCHDVIYALFVTESLRLAIVGEHGLHRLPMLCLATLDKARSIGVRPDHILIGQIKLNRPNFLTQLGFRGHSDRLLLCTRLIINALVLLRRQLLVVSGRNPIMALVQRSVRVDGGGRRDHLRQRCLQKGDTAFLTL